MAPLFTTQLKVTRRNIRRRHCKVGDDDDFGLDGGRGKEDDGHDKHDDDFDDDYREEDGGDNDAY